MKNEESKIKMGDWDLTPVSADATVKKGQLVSEEYNQLFSPSVCFLKVFYVGV